MLFRRTMQEIVEACQWVPNDRDQFEMWAAHQDFDYAILFERGNWELYVMVDGSERGIRIVPGSWIAVDEYDNILHMNNDFFHTSF